MFGHKGERVREKKGSLKETGSKGQQGRVREGERKNVWIKGFTVRKGDSCLHIGHTDICQGELSHTHTHTMSKVLDTLEVQAAYPFILSIC